MVSVEILKEHNSGILEHDDCSTTNDDANNNLFQNENSSGPLEDRKACNVCGFEPCTTRCSLCKVVYYCSVECQRDDWNKGGHKTNCIGKQQRKKKKTKTKTKRPIPMGPIIPPPKNVRNELDAKRAMQELWSITEYAMSEGDDDDDDDDTTIPATETKAAGGNLPQTNPQTKPTIRSSPTKIPIPGVNHYQDQQQHQKDASATEEELLVTSPDPENEKMSFVVEEMPQICRFQLILTTKEPRTQRHRTDKSYSSSSLLTDTSIAVSAESVGRSGSRTLVTVREENEKRTLFKGEFPRPIRASEITWRIAKNKNNNNKNGTQGGDSTTTTNDDDRIVFRLPYPYDPSNTSSLALGGSLDHSYGGLSSCSDSTLDEINTVVCGACHLPLVAPGCHTDSVPKKSPISHVFPLPQGHWDEIADYLICYDGQPVVDFSAGSECAEPSIALQDASMLCFHRKDVEKAVCALAVDGYGELTEVPENSNNSDGFVSQSNDLGEFCTKSASSSFVLPNPPKTTRDAGVTEEKKDDPDITNNNGNFDNNEPEISATSAVIRGDRTWQDAVDGDSVSLCCARCCSPLGFASLGSPETWRFWKHRLSIQVQAQPVIQRKNKSYKYKAETKEKYDRLSNIVETMPIAAKTVDAVGGFSSNAKLSRMPLLTVVPITKPLGSCSSFLARELVRYAESKAIFTFVVRREGRENSIHGNNNECLLLRMLSWETAMATSFQTKTNARDEASSALLLRKVAKIVFEITSDPTVTAAQARSNKHGMNNTNSDGDAAPTQWFWGGVDLCCPPPTAFNKSNAKNNNNNNNCTTIPGVSQLDDSPPPEGVSTVRLELPSDEFDVVMEDLVSGKSLFEPEIANATILLQMGGLSEGYGLTAVALQ